MKRLLVKENTKLERDTNTKAILSNDVVGYKAALARRIGRSRASVHSAVKVLRRRGILREDRLEMAPHLIDAEEWQNSRSIDYEWSDERR